MIQLLVWFLTDCVICADLLPCTTNVCQNGGSCYKKGAQNICVCAPGYTGQLCETGTHCSPHWPPNSVMNDEEIIQACVVCLQMSTSASRTRVWTEPPVWMESTPSPVSASPVTRESSANKVSCTWVMTKWGCHTESVENQDSAAVFRFIFARSTEENRYVHPSDVTITVHIYSGLDVKQNIH